MIIFSAVLKNLKSNKKKEKAYGPAEDGVLLFPVRLSYVEVCIIISLACVIRSFASPVTDQCRNRIFGVSPKR
jgi:hypothetical protein